MNADGSKETRDALLLRLQTKRLSVFRPHLFPEPDKHLAGP